MSVNCVTTTPGVRAHEYLDGGDRADPIQSLPGVQGKKGLCKHSTQFARMYEVEKHQTEQTV